MPGISPETLRFDLLFSETESVTTGHADDETWTACRELFGDEREDYPEALDRHYEHGLPLTYALNAVNRLMGREDLYPFNFPEPVIEKLRFVHGRVRAGDTHAPAVTA